MINQELWNTLKSMDPVEVERRSLAAYNSENKHFTLNVCHRDYLVYPEKQLIQAAESPSEPPIFFLHLAAVNYLIGAKDIPLVGRWVGVKEFPSGPLFFRGPHEMPTGRIVDLFGRDRHGFASACQKWGGIPVEGGDVAFELLVFPRLPVRMLLWLKDKEFPARLTYLFDSTANVHLLLDGIWAVGKLLEFLLTQ
jgi:hypothetical protein